MNNSLIKKFEGRSNMTLKNANNHFIQTDRLNMSYLEGGSGKETLMLLHGNISSNIFWTNTIKSLESHFHIIAPDFRGYGETEALPIDATRGLKDWSDDLKSFINALELSKPVHFLGWSMGGGIAMQYAIDHPKDVKSLILVNPISPYGFGGTKDITGTPCFPNYAGSGGGTANPDFVESLRTQEEGDENPNSALNVMNQFYFNPPFRAEENEEIKYLRSMLSTKVGEGFYPGLSKTCNEWPGVIPGEDGMNNAFSPKYMNLADFIKLNIKPPVLWLRGEKDTIVSDTSLLDLGYLGKLGHVPGWPGEDVFPPQPMVSQMRHFLEQYKNDGGVFDEVVIDGAGHSPHVEKPNDFNKQVINFMESITE